ncbi:hypothetical protein [Winogradskyella haliclonae]|nr:hypothetical protein [Winogradskyella haliclonae]
MRTSKIVLLILVCFFSIGCKENQSRKKTPEELRHELKQNEQSNPLDYISVAEAIMTPQRKKVKKAVLFKKAKYVDDGAIINGYIQNKASLAKFKDVKLKVTYYSNTKSIISEKTFILYEYYYPNTSESFTIKVYPPESYSTLNINVINAIGE